MTECSVHAPEDMRNTYRARDYDFCQSTIREPNSDSHGLHRFDLEVKVYVDVPTECFLFRNRAGATVGTLHYPQNVPANAADTMYDQFQRAVHRGWNGGLWLSHASARARRRGVRGLWCGVTLRRVETSDESDLWLRVGHDVMQPELFRDNCHYGGIANDWPDMYLRYPQPGAPAGNPFQRIENITVRGRPVRINQNTAAHEFGHYLNFQHTCADLGGMNDAVTYCISRPASGERTTDNLMAIGDVLFAEHARPWLDRINANHHIACESAWEPHCTRQGDNPR